MPIDLEEDTGSKAASVKLDRIGDTWVGMLVDYNAKAPLFEFRPANSQLPQRRALDINGNEKTQDVLTVLLLDKTTCRVRMPRVPGQTGDYDVDGKEAAGTVARVFIKGHNRWTPDRADSFREAKQAHGTLQVGDVIKGEVTAIEDVGASQPKKVISFSLFKPRPEDQALVERCEDEYRKLKAAGTKAIDLETEDDGETPSAPDNSPW